MRQSRTKIATQSDILYVSHADFYYPYAHAFCLVATYLVQEASKMIAIIKTKSVQIVPEMWSQLKARGLSSGRAVISYFLFQWHVVKSSIEMMYLLEGSATTGG